jgi:hypothetical protein
MVFQNWTFFKKTKMSKMEKLNKMFFVAPEKYYCFWLFFGKAWMVSKKKKKKREKNQKNKNSRKIPKITHRTTRCVIFCLFFQAFPLIFYTTFS